MKNCVASVILVCSLFVVLQQQLIAAPADTIGQRSFALNESGVKAVTANKYDEAEKLFREALAVDRYNVSAAYNLAGVLITKKKDAEAARLLETYSQQNPKDIGLLIRLGDAYFSLKQVTEATAAYERAYALDSTAPGLSFKLASIYSLQNNWKKSEQYFELAAKSESNNPSIFSNLAAIKLSLGKIDESIANAKRAIQIAPTAQAYATLGAAYEQKSDFKNSLIAFERARDLGDKSPELQAKIKEVKKLIS